MGNKFRLVVRRKPHIYFSFECRMWLVGHDMDILVNEKPRYRKACDFIHWQNQFRKAARI